MLIDLGIFAHLTDLGKKKGSEKSVSNANQLSFLFSLSAVQGILNSASGKLLSLSVDQKIIENLRGIVMNSCLFYCLNINKQNKWK